MSSQIYSTIIRKYAYAIATAAPAGGWKMPPKAKLLSDLDEKFSQPSEAASALSSLKNQWNSNEIYREFQNDATRIWNAKNLIAAALEKQKVDLPKIKDEAVKKVFDLGLLEEKKVKKVGRSNVEMAVELLMVGKGMGPRVSPPAASSAAAAVPNGMPSSTSQNSNSTLDKGLVTDELLAAFRKEIDSALGRIKVGTESLQEKFGNVDWSDLKSEDGTDAAFGDVSEGKEIPGQTFTSYKLRDLKLFEAARPRNEDGQAIPKPPLELPVQDIRLALVEYDKEGREMHGVSEKAFKAPIIGSRTSEMDENYTGQYALLGRPAETKTEDPEEDPNLLYTNVTHPWSAFICGLQGSGKSHTLSSMLENFLIPSEILGKVEKPLSGLVFHFSQYTGSKFFNPCEAAFLAYPAPDFDLRVPVTILVSPTNYLNMEKCYSDIPGVTVKKLRVHPRQLTIQSMLDLMLVDINSEPLYMAGVKLLLREMAEVSTVFDYGSFKRQLSRLELNARQRRALELRFSLLDSFIDKHDDAPEDLLNVPPGSMVIVDLSCPFVDANLACAFFNICVRIFMENTENEGKVVAVDEAHKYMAENHLGSRNLTESLVTLIRQQRHYGVRVLVSTQEPSINPKFIELSNISVIHNFASPEWLDKLYERMSIEDGIAGKEELLEKIVALDTGEALISCPAAMVGGVTQSSLLGAKLLKAKIRRRVTWDGGKSVLVGSSEPDSTAHLDTEQEGSLETSTIAGNEDDTEQAAHAS